MSDPVVERMGALADQLEAEAVAAGVDGPYSPDIQFAAGLQSAAERIRAALNRGDVRRDYGHD